MPAPTFGNILGGTPNDGGGASSCTIALNNNKSTVLCSLAWGYLNAAPPSDLKYNGVAMTLIGQRNDFFCGIAVWRLLGAAAGANNLVIADGWQYSYIDAVAFCTDADTFTDYASLYNNAGVSTPYGPTIANMDADSLLFAATSERTTTTSVPVTTAAGTSRWANRPALSGNGNSPYHSGQTRAGTGSVSGEFDPDINVFGSTLGFRMSIAGGGGSVIPQAAYYRRQQRNN